MVENKEVLLVKAADLFQGVSQVTIKAALLKGSRYLIACRVQESPEVDVRWLLAHQLGQPDAYLYAWPDQVLSDAQLKGFIDLLQMRAQGQPVAYIIGRQGFWSMDLLVNDQVLIPRPETELLVEVALSLSVPQDAYVADWGAGSGAIGLALALEKPNWFVCGLEKQTACLKVIRHNQKAHQISNYGMIQGNWGQSFKPNSLHLIASNPPYIRQSDPHLDQGDIRFEPKYALVSEALGLKDIQEILRDAELCLVAGGWLLIEHGYDQGEQVRALFRHAGFRQVTSKKDYSDHERITMGVKLPSTRD